MLIRKCFVFLARYLYAVSFMLPREPCRIKAQSNCSREGLEVARHFHTFPGCERVRQSFVLSNLHRLSYERVS